MSQQGVDHVAEDDEHALQIVRDIVAGLNTVKRHELDTAEPVPPAHAPEQLYETLIREDGP